MMLPKAHLTSHSKMSGSRGVIIPSWLSGSLRPFLVQFCVFLPFLLNIFCFWKVHTISVLYCVNLYIKCSPGFCNFLEEISQFSSVAQSFLTLCDPMNHSTPGLLVYHQLLEFTQTHVHQVGDAILYKKGLNELDNHDGVITRARHPEMQSQVGLRKHHYKQS